MLKGSVRVPYGALTGPSRAPGDMQNNRRLPSGGNLKWISPVRVPHGGISKYTRRHIQSESEKMYHFLKVVLFEVWIFNHEFHDIVDVVLHDDDAADDDNDDDDDED